jgi:uncharacterized protein YegP (UPF0339 family)
MRFKIFSSRKIRGRRWYFRARSDRNHKIIISSEGYYNHDDALATVHQIKREAADAEIDDTEWEDRLLTRAFLKGAK